MSMTPPREEAVMCILDKLGLTEANPIYATWEKALRRLSLDLLEALNDRLPEVEDE